MSAGGEIETLYRFLCPRGDCAEGSAPGELLQDTDGSFYGTTGAGGAALLGTAFKLSAGLSAFVEARPDYGAPGAPVEIRGTNLSGATSVSFNGVAAAFRLVSELSNHHCGTHGRDQRNYPGRHSYRRTFQQRAL